MVTDEAYQKHSVFDQIERYADFYKDLSDSIFQMSTKGTRAICNIDSYLYMSINGTLCSIHSTLKDGRINDAYALLRKYHDSIVINLYANLYLDEHFSVDNLIVAKINGWLKGTDQLPEYRVMSQYIRKANELEEIWSLLNEDERYKQIRDGCNDHTHYNFFSNVMLNDNTIYLKNRGVELDRLLGNITDLLIFHTVCIFRIRQHYMMSRDHMDYLELGMTPPENSQYWVSPIVQKFFDEVIKVKRPDLAAVVKSFTSMHLE